MGYYFISIFTISWYIVVLPAYMYVWRTNITIHSVNTVVPYETTDRYQHALRLLTSGWPRSLSTTA